MLYLYATVQVAQIMLLDRLSTPPPNRHDQRDPEAGGFTLEVVSWGVALLALVGIVVAAVKQFAESESAKIISPNG